jgi:hypothetical protein
LAIAAALIAWLGAARVEERNRARQQDAAAVLSEGVLYEALPGDPALVVAKDVGSGKELWRAELGAVTTKPVLLVREEAIEIQIAGTPWMTLDKSSGEPVEQ